MARPCQMSYQETNKSESYDEASRLVHGVKSRIHIFSVISSGVTCVRPRWHSA
ncbi:MAG: hypothetical protein JEZ07_19025 [Phycisphaerae bacterium]|nr:hypothetical protein [Phycisphaerae bacterium]